ncbi:hypothetical protein [Pseudomonas sp. R1-7]|uniref:hypothetical protein n=1 Tax=Pseudomonas sp. R1-7 TaxID=2817398 RepID=UPI003DA7E730
MPTSSIELDWAACDDSTGLPMPATADAAWARLTAMCAFVGASTFMMTGSVVSDAQWVAAIHLSVPSSPRTFSKRTAVFTIGAVSRT